MLSEKLGMPPDMVRMMVASKMGGGGGSGAPEEGESGDGEGGVVASAEGPPSAPEQQGAAPEGLRAGFAAFKRASGGASEEPPAVPDPCSGNKPTTAAAGAVSNGVDDCD